MSPQDSEALRSQSTDYPAEYKGRVPLKVKMLKDARPDAHSGVPTTFAKAGEVLPAWVNLNGAVWVLCGDGEWLGLVTGEYEVAEWHPTAPSAPHSPCSGEGSQGP